MVIKADPSLAGKFAQVVRINGNQKVLGNGIALKSDGSAKYYVQLGQTDTLKVVVTPTAPSGGLMTSTPLAESDAFTITVTK